MKNKKTLANHFKTCKIKKEGLTIFFKTIADLKHEIKQLKGIVPPGVVADEPILVADDPHRRAVNTLIAVNSQLKAENKRLREENTYLKRLLKRADITVGHVYFINVVDTNQFKIGYTNISPTTRLSALQVGCPHELALHRIVPYIDPKKLEKHLHDCFSAKKIRGEWFTLTIPEVDSIVDFLANDSL
jgi:hypothetical protein